MAEMYKFELNDDFWLLRTSNITFTDERTIKSVNIDRNRKL